MTRQFLCSSPFCSQGKAVQCSAVQYKTQLITSSFVFTLWYIRRFSVEKCGELSLQAAEAYYEYGNALLSKEEENPSGNLLGPTDESGGNEVVDIDVEEAEEDEGAKDDGAEEEGEGGEGDEEDQPDDMQIAFENLDVARLILEKETHPSRDMRLLLSHVYIRIGDLLRQDEQVHEALYEYEKALHIRDGLCESSDRLLCDAHFALAVTHVDLSSAKSGSEEDPIEHKHRALYHYRGARECLNLSLMELSGKNEAGSEANKEKDVNELKDLIDVLTETIDALEADLKEVCIESIDLSFICHTWRAIYLKGSSLIAGASGTAPVTTIGFGPPVGATASSSSTVGVKSTLDSREPATGSSASADNDGVVTMQVRITFSILNR